MKNHDSPEKSSEGSKKGGIPPPSFGQYLTKFSQKHNAPAHGETFRMREYRRISRKTA